MSTEREDKRIATFMKILIPLVVVLAIIYLAKSGYKAGHWLHEWVNK
ncbi:MAG: hypothetical protein QM737_03850 [Ferruginibacter sp.]